MGKIPWPILISILHRWVQYLGCGKDRPLRSRNGPSVIGPQLFGSSAVVWCVMCLDFLNWALWVRFHGRYWYQSFIDGSNIWGVDRTDPWGPAMDHPPLGRSYLVVESSCYMALIIIPCKRKGSSAAKYELYILLPAEQRCSKKCVAALQADTFVYLYICIYKYIYKYIYGLLKGIWLD